jgi:predicted MFS family arabinose efflux permease
MQKKGASRMTYSRQINQTQHKVCPINLFMCLLGLLSIAFTVYIRAIPQVMNPNLLSLIHTTPAQLSDLNLYYQYYFIIMLIVAGIVTDFVGPRIVLPVALAAAMVGNCLFATAISWHVAAHGKLLMGFAHPFIFIGVLTLGSQWLPKRYFTFFVGLLFATLLFVPNNNPLLAQLTSIDNLQLTMIISNIIAGLVILGFVFTARARKPFVPRTTFGEIGGTLMKYRIWVLSIISLMGWLANTFLLNFGNFFLQKNFHYPILDAESTIKIVFMSFASGAVLMGILADNMGRKEALIFMGYLLGAISFTIALFLPAAWFAPVSGLLFLTGLFTSAAIICYGKAYDICVPGTAGLTFGLMAFLTTLGNNYGGRMLGTWIDSYQNHLTVEKLQMILLVLPAALLVGAALTFTIPKNPDRNSF